jgi:hypothetical protein
MRLNTLNTQNPEASRGALPPSGAPTRALLWTAGDLKRPHPLYTAVDELESRILTIIH